MDKKKLILLVGALVIAVGTALAARSMFAGTPTPVAEAAVPESTGPKVLVAQRALPTGTIITADSVAYQRWPKDMVGNAYFIDGEADMSKLLGTVVRHSITAGEPVTQGALVRPGDRGFLAAALGPGMRAITIPVSAQTGVSGFVFPGDRVDLMLTQTVKGAEGQALQATETILRNIRVLATDTSTKQEQVEGKTVVREYKTVTLEVTPRIAEKVSVAQTIGSISLALRSIADNKAQLEQAIANGDIDLPEGTTAAEEQQILQLAMSRPQDEKSSYVTGGDVSRFQRRTMPSQQAPRQTQQQYAPQQAGPQSGPVAIPRGPAVRVTRGKATSIEAIGRNGSTQLIESQSKGMRSAAGTVPSALSTVR